jgi:para-aminobenzoate synthetase component 1
LNRLIHTIEVDNTSYPLLKEKMLHYINQCNIFSFIDNNNYNTSKYEWILAFDMNQSFENQEELFDFQMNHNDWVFGHIAYDYKNHHIEQQPNPIGFKDLFFFQPKVVIYKKYKESIIHIESLAANPKIIWESILNTTIEPLENTHLELSKRIAQEEYVKKIEQLQLHIKNGDCYEINFCNESYGYKHNFNARSAFLKLNVNAPNPFAAFYKNDNHFLICASPERFLRHEQLQITAQPIKGTSKRGVTTEEDIKLATELKNSLKDKAENVMIVDLMRNDLSIHAVAGSVTVKELFGIYSYPNVHQMISTITSKVKNSNDAIKTLFESLPIGSMTGAPKRKVTELIATYEPINRNLFAGTIGYFEPNGNFDFNVVIRSLFYNSSNGYISYQTGGAITSDSEPLKEWEETCIKAQSIEQILH